MSGYIPNIEEIKSLRLKTGAGINDCKEALADSGGNIEKAIEFLRKKGVAKGAKRAEKTATEGVIGVYVHQNNALVSMVEINCETDFVAKNDEFKDLARNLAVHVAAMNTLYISRDLVPEEEIEAVKKEVEEDAIDKPEDVKAKILESKLEKYYKTTCLMEQNYFKDPSKTVQDLMNETLAKIGEKIVISRIITWKVGVPANQSTLLNQGNK